MPSAASISLSLSLSRARSLCVCMCVSSVPIVALMYYIRRDGDPVYEFMLGMSLCHSVLPRPKGRGATQALFVSGEAFLPKFKRKKKEAASAVPTVDGMRHVGSIEITAGLVEDRDPRMEWMCLRRETDIRSFLLKRSTPHSRPTSWRSCRPASRTASSSSRTPSSTSYLTSKAHLSF